MTSAPLIANDKVIVGFGGDEFAARGRLEAYNLSDGKLAWNCQSNGTDKETCLTPDTNKAHPEHGTAGHNISLSSYPGDEWEARRRLALGLVLLRPGAEARLRLHGQPRQLEPDDALRRRRPRRSAIPESGTTNGR